MDFRLVDGNDVVKCLPAPLGVEDTTENIETLVFKKPLPIGGRKAC